jgi:hypothetical protein
LIGGREEIKQRRAILESANVDIMTLNEYKKLKEELNVHSLSLQDPRILLSILKTIRQIGYEPQKIVREFSRIKSLRQMERQLNNSCKDLEAMLDRYNDVLPLCEQIAGLRIGMGVCLIQTYYGGMSYGKYSAYLSLDIDNHSISSFTIHNRY